MDTYVYEYNGKDYINLTNKCTNDCTFCLRNDRDGVGNYNLWLETEPTAEQVIALLDEHKRDVVFCGYGEPTMKIDTLLRIAEHVHAYGGKTRLNTNGHGSEYNGRDLAAEIKGRIDAVSISLNGSNPEKYAEVCRGRYGARGFDIMLCFARECVKNGIETVMTVVSIAGDDEIEKCREIAEGIGAKFRVRQYF